MSIIHDALKKVQQGQSPKPDETPYVYSKPADPASPEEEQPVEHLPSTQNKAKSIVALICAYAITIAAFVFLYMQLCSTFPKLKDSIESTFNNLIHKKTQVDVKAMPTRELKPLAKITIIPKPAVVPKTPVPANPVKLPAAVNTTTASPSQPAPTEAAPTEVPVSSDTTQANAPVTLNVHGVMSNGSSNVALINDQVYQEGDDIDGVKIVKIRLDSITVNNNGKEETIRVKD